jgi:REP-associated tyrosine transposase
MSTPKHRTAPGTSYFVTTKCWQGRAVFQVPENAETLIEALFHYRDRNSYLLHEFVVMPDHLHLMLTPSPTTSLEKTMQFIKGGSSYRICKGRNQKMEIWQVGFHDWTIRDSHDWQTKVEYIHTNPVRAKLVQKPEDWPYSSASGKFTVDPTPDKFLQLSSGAKAQTTSPLTLGLKPQPPKENAKQVPPKATVAGA